LVIKTANTLAMLKPSLTVAYVRLVCFHKHKKLSLLIHVLLSTFFINF